MIENWLGVNQSTEKNEDGQQMLPVLESNQKLLQTLREELNSVVENPVFIEFDLRKPYPNPKLSMVIKNPKTAKLGEVIQMEYLFEYLEDKPNSQFVVQIDVEEESKLLSFVGKTIHLIEFNEGQKSVKVLMEALVYGTGVYPVPDLIITDFNGKICII